MIVIMRLFQVFTTAILLNLEAAQCSTTEVHPLLSRQNNTTTTITVNPNIRHQRIDGFGFSAAFQRANTLYNLSPAPRRAVLDLLFNTSTGAGFSILRNGIGSSPDSRNDWMNSILPVSPGSPNAIPNYVWDRNDSSQLWLSKEAMKYGVETFYADAWSAPGFMKTNGNDSNGGVLCGMSGTQGTNCTADWRQDYADYLVQLVRFYEQEGVGITHLGFLNEPDDTTFYASMRSTGTQAADFIRILSDTLHRNNMNDVRILCCDGTGWNVSVGLTQELVAAGVEPLLYAITTHEYSSPIRGHLNTTLPVWQSENSDLKGSWDTSFYTNGSSGEGLTWANTIHNALVNSNLSAYLYWEGVEWPGGSKDSNSKLIELRNGTYSVSKRLWTFAQFSRLARPGAVRIDAKGSPDTSAYLNSDGSVSVVVINGGPYVLHVTVAVEGFDGGVMAQAWLTDNTHDMVQIDVRVGNDGLIRASIPGRAMVGFSITSGEEMR